MRACSGILWIPDLFYRLQLFMAFDIMHIVMLIGSGKRGTKQIEEDRLTLLLNVLK